MISHSCVHSSYASLPYHLELQTAISAALYVGKEVILKKRSAVSGIHLKEDSSIVCDTDKIAGKELSAILQEHFPSYGVLQEEAAGIDTRNEHEHNWIIDPLDGTISYLNGDDTFGIMLALEKEGSPVLGVAYRPSIDELTYAVKGQGAYIITGGKEKEPERMRVSGSDELEILTSLLRDSRQLEAMLDSLKSKNVVPMPSSFKIVEVAKGNATLFLCPEDISLNAWDMCAAQLILEEAGGKFTDLYGKPFDYKTLVKNTQGVIASNGLLHDHVLRRIADVLNIQQY